MGEVTVIGAGLAGCEAAWQLAQRGHHVRLHDLKPGGRTPAQSSDNLAELVCSNSLRAANVENAVGLLKEEMRRLNSLIMRAADATRIPAGGALAVDREKFSKFITDHILSADNIAFVSGEVTAIPDERVVIVATGPLTTGALYADIARVMGEQKLYFFDAAAPIVSFESIDMSTAFFASRYEKGSDDYINCPMNREQYLSFYRELVAAEQAELHGFENSRVFEGCMPIEVMAKRGEDTIRYGPLKPVGIVNPQTGREAYAIVQLRRDNAEGTLYNLVGFQTHLKFPEQRRVFRMIPGLERAEFMRYGVMHRNTYLHSPGILNSRYEAIQRPGLFFAGQITGVEGYVESAASGLSVGIHAARFLEGKKPLVFGTDTAIGALGGYISNNSVTDFQPMNVNFGIISPPNFKFRGKRNKNELLAARALSEIDRIAAQIQEDDR